jgi:hypothetical protein
VADHVTVLEEALAETRVVALAEVLGEALAETRVEALAGALAETRVEALVVIPVVVPVEDLVVVEIPVEVLEGGQVEDFEEVQEVAQRLMPASRNQACRGEADDNIINKIIVYEPLNVIAIILYKQKAPKYFQDDCSGQCPL